MNTVKTIEFIRALRLFCKERGFTLVENTKNGPAGSIVILDKDETGKAIVITFTINASEKDMSPGMGRAMLRRTKERLMHAAAREASERIIEGIKELADLISKSF